VSVKHLRYTTAVSCVLALGACSTAGPSAELAGDGFSYTVTVTGDELTGESKYMGAAPGGTKYWGVTVEVDAPSNAPDGSISPPSMFVAVPANQTAVTPSKRSGPFNILTAGSCTFQDAPGLLSGSKESAGVPEGFCLFELLHDSGGDGDSNTLTYVTNGGFTGEGPKEPVYFAANSTAIGQASGRWTQLTA